jgi:hypothetical protein
VENLPLMVTQTKKFFATFKRESIKWVDLYGQEFHQRETIWWRECSALTLTDVLLLNKHFTMIGSSRILKPNCWKKLSIPMLLKIWRTSIHNLSFNKLLLHS